MIVIFQCFGGTHTSVTAASIYTGRLPRSRTPRLEELLALPYFDRSGRGEIGILNYMGRDRRDSPVLALGSANWGPEIRGLAASFLRLPGAAAPKVAVIDCLPEVTLQARLGGFLSRRLGLAAIGRPLVCRAIQQSYPRLLRLVDSFERNPASFFLN